MRKEDQPPENEYGESRVPYPVSRVSSHVPVLVRETLDFLNVRPEGIYIDATLGGGGHAQEILKRLGSGRLLGLDRDPGALELAGDRLGPFGGKLIMQHGNFAQIDELHAASGLPPVDGVVADLGLSSMQLNDASRGFSFNLPGPLDMRMDPGSETTAADLVNNSSERELANIFFELGEERHSRRIARAIVKARPYRVTTELAQVVTRAIPSRAGLHQIHPATRSFMALRLAVNAELENLEQFLDRVLLVLRPGGRVVILSFHSLEDRRVKQAFRHWQGEGQATTLTRKVVRPGDEEVQSNPRARSAKLRAAEKQGTGNRGQGPGIVLTGSLIPCPDIQMATATVTLPKSRRRPRDVPAAGRANFPEFYFVKPINNSRLVREVDVERRRECFSLLGLGTLVFLFVLMFAWEHFQCVRHGYEIEQLKAEYRALEEQNHRLCVEQAALADPHRIDTLARNRLGMVTPDPKQVIRMGEPEPAAEALESPEMARNFSAGNGDILHEP